MNLIDDFHGQPAIQLQSPGGDRATVLLHGAHVVSWIPAGGSERLYLSPRSGYGARTGDPRRRAGDLSAIQPARPGLQPAEARLRAHPALVARRHGRWPAARRRRRPRDRQSRRRCGCGSRRMRGRSRSGHIRFSLTLTVSLEPRQLILALQVESAGDEPLAFTAALHTYLAVDDIAGTTLGGLAGSDTWIR